MKRRFVLKSLVLVFLMALLFGAQSASPKVYAGTGCEYRESTVTYFYADEEHTQMVGGCMSGCGLNCFGQRTLFSETYYNGWIQCCN
jgi:hypothetical protein